MPTYELKNTVQRYDWGSHSFIPELLGEQVPSAEPQAELWMGAHPKASSEALVDGRWKPLTGLIGSDPARWLGAPVSSRFRQELPFLLKVLAAERPLSMQAHPNRAQAARGFQAEEDRGVPRGAPERNYKDPNHKPELLAALIPFDALCGFRPPAQTAELFRALDVAALRPYAECLGEEPAGLRRAFSELMRLDAQNRQSLIASLVDACSRLSTEVGEFSGACRWVAELGRLYPSDPGVVTALMLNHVRLEPGEALFLPAGNLHLYLRGAGIEIMANSDNVLRAGLTSKHIDLEELLNILDLSTGRPPLITLVPADGVEKVYPTPTEEFRLSRLELEPTKSWRCPERRGPEILICVSGTAEIRELGRPPHELHRGRSLFVTGDAGAYEGTGTATLFRATAGRT
ncbi:MAG TPA: mannose-6-phosphate isomerase, class I [Polyangiaceae bacterium]|jgi:mannose-6-phosphate isomerase